MALPLTTRARLAAVLLATILLAACAPAYRGAPIYGPFEAADPEVARGELVFAEHCDQCHPGGAGGLGPALNNRPLPAGLIEFQVRNGLGAMPSFSEEQINDADLAALAAYVVALRGHTKEVASEQN